MVPTSPGQIRGVGLKRERLLILMLDFGRQQDWPSRAAISRDMAMANEERSGLSWTDSLAAELALV
jgi:hypothetical protein